ncbi:MULTISPECIES: ATP-dependent zinc protease family protein [Tenacibaculum]|uniref:ATP-dependent zinc protease family protein n=1 Tax=Tenacibaculum TaxID=104267 RepID=UPI001F0A675B|nr:MULTISPECIES: RimK/LysX family protein [Tenacibaculum]MCH3882424.1 RimK/LysX family protein [Tenacibaculum aquimarinum]MCH3885789.1 RimK/LysX family protein [Tenacibaculum aquimarinum]MDO6600093.1 RimK/LysX family protein [Tenacibaculum sp. 1_MG-2023]
MKITIGRFDKGDFPELSLFDIDLKIDSGAYTSSIHCINIKEVKNDKESLIKYTLLDPEHPLYNNKEFTSRNYTSKMVKSSNGIAEKRFMIQTEIIIFNKSFPIDLTLSQRKEMKFPILLGRKFLNKRFIIDAIKKDLSYKLKQKN